MITTRLISEILEAEKERLFRYASYRLRDINDVEDTLHNLYVKLLSKPERLAGVGNVRSYIYRALCNACNDVVRSSSRVDKVSIDSFELLDSATMQPENFDEEFTLINKLLSLLPEEQSETIRLHLHCGLTFQEVSEIMQVPLPTAKARFRYGIEKLRDGLKRENLL